MNNAELYRVISREMKRLLETGAITQRGRPRLDTETELFNRQTRAFKQALKSLPTDLQADWKRSPKMFEPLLKFQKSMDARERAQTRAKKRVDSGMPPAEQALSMQASSRATVTAERLQAVKQAISTLLSKNIKVSPNAVAVAMRALYGEKYAVTSETTRKDIAKIRHDRQS